MTGPSLPDLRAEVKRLKSRLADLDDFEALWDTYATQLRQIVVVLAGPEPDMAWVRRGLEAAEATRVQVANLGRVKYDEKMGGQTEFSYLTDANLRTESDKFFQYLTEAVSASEWGAHNTRHVVTENALEARLGEAKGRITRKREAMKLDLRDRERRLAEHARDPATEVTLRALLKKWRGQAAVGLRRFLWWALRDPLKKLVGLLLIALLLAGVRKFLPGVEQTVRGWLGRAAADSAQAAPR